MIYCIHLVFEFQNLRYLCKDTKGRGFGAGREALSASLSAKISGALDIRHLSAGKITPGDPPVIGLGCPTRVEAKSPDSRLGR